MARLIILGALALFSCGAAKKKEVAARPFMPAAEIFSFEIDATKSMLLERLKGFQEAGQIVSRRKDGSADSIGDSLFFSGLAIGTVPCGSEEKYLTALEHKLNLAGTFYRFDPLPENHKRYPVSYDGVVAVMYGLAKKWRDCPALHDRIRGIVAPFRDYVSQHGVFYAGAEVPAAYEYGLDYMPELLAHRLGLVAEPHQDRKTKAEVAVVAWVTGTIAKKAPCYRIHLATLNFLGMHYLGKDPSDNAKTLYCGATKDFGFQLADYICGRMTASAYLDAWQLNKWEYEIQRCAAYERVDGFEKEHPGLDFLLMRDIGG